MADQDTEQVAIQFYWDVGSTNSYFAFHLLRPIAEEFGAAIEYIPFNLGYVFRHHKYVLSEEPKAKLKNRATDLKRWAKKYSLPFNVPEQFPIKTSDALKGSLGMRRLRLEEAYIEKLFSTYYHNDSQVLLLQVFEQIPMFYLRLEYPNDHHSTTKIDIYLSQEHDLLI